MKMIATLVARIDYLDTVYVEKIDALEARIDRLSEAFHGSATRGPRNVVRDRLRYRLIVWAILVAFVTAVLQVFAYGVLIRPRLSSCEHK